MRFTTLFTLGAALLWSFTSASPIPIEERAGAGVFNLSPDVLAAWTQVARYASASYCLAPFIKAWTCYDCKKIGGKPQILATGGDAQLTTRYFVANNGSAIVVAIAGTNGYSPISWSVDLNFAFKTPSSTFFPDAPGVQVHQGFYTAFLTQAAGIGPAVQAAVKAGTKTVIVTGHSQGGSLTQLHATYLQRLLGSEATVYARAFAPARVGNKAWADYVDATLGERSQWISNSVDIVPQLPPREWGFQHSSNEIWIPVLGGNTYRSCPGQENNDCQNSLGLVGSFALGAAVLELPAHLGPYAGVSMAGIVCG